MNVQSLMHTRSPRAPVHDDTARGPGLRQLLGHLERLVQQISRPLVGDKSIALTIWVLSEIA
jgi:hypothetical protein